MQRDSVFDIFTVELRSTSTLENATRCLSLNKTRAQGLGENIKATAYIALEFGRCGLENI